MERGPLSISNSDRRQPTYLAVKISKYFGIMVYILSHEYKKTEEKKKHQGITTLHNIHFTETKSKVNLAAFVHISVF